MTSMYLEYADFNVWISGLKVPEGEFDLVRNLRILYNDIWGIKNGAKKVGKVKTGTITH